MSYLCFSFLFQENDNKHEAILGLSTSDSSNEGFVQNMIVSFAQNDNGIISVWQGIHTLRNCIFYQCQGKVINIAYGDPSITFIDCNFDPRLSTIEISCSNCFTSPTQTIIEMNCVFPNIPILTCFIKKRTLVYKQQLFLFLGLYSS